MQSINQVLDSEFLLTLLAPLRKEIWGLGLFSGIKLELLTKNDNQNFFFKITRRKSCERIFHRFFSLFFISWISVNGFQFNKLRERILFIFPEVKKK